MQASVKVCFILLLAALPSFVASCGSCGTFTSDCDCYAGCPNACGGNVFDRYCTSCTSGQYKSGDNCKCCYWPNCGSGRRRSGTQCNGGSSDTQKDKCADCAWPNCGSGRYRSGSACTGTHTDDRQNQCASCVWPNCGSGRRRSGTQCSGTAFSDTQKNLCTNCAWPNCGSGNYRSGSACTGTHTDDRQNQCSPCQWNTCSAGYYRSGSPCTGTDFSDTQNKYCTPCKTSCPDGYRLEGTCSGNNNFDSTTCVFIPTQNPTSSPTTNPTTSNPTISPHPRVPTFSPTTPQPTKNPTTPQPTKSPTTPQPTISPTESPPVPPFSMMYQIITGVSFVFLCGVMFLIYRRSKRKGKLEDMFDEFHGLKTGKEAKVAKNPKYQSTSDSRNSALSISGLRSSGRGDHASSEFSVKNPFYDGNPFYAKESPFEENFDTSQYMAVFDFKAENDDELSVDKGQIVQSLGQVEGTEWMLCINPDTEKKGIVPLEYLSAYGGAL